MIHLSPDYRVRPYDALQWVLERRAVTGGGRWKHQASRLNDAGEAGARWVPIAYCRTRIGLETALSRLRCDGVHLDASALASVPERFPEPSCSAAEQQPAELEATP